MRATIVAAEGERVAERDRLGELYQQHAQGGMRLAYLLTGDQAAAEDLFHDAFIRVGAKLGAIREPAAFGGYLRRAIVNQHTSRMRRVRLERSHVEREAHAVTSRRASAPASEGMDDRDAIWQALQQLPARQRAAVVLRYYDDQTEAATAKALGCSVSAVKSMMQRAMVTLRTQIAGDDDE